MCKWYWWKHRNLIFRQHNVENNSTVKQFIYCPDTRGQVKVFIQREHGEKVSDPLDYDFTIQQIKKDGEVYLDTEFTQDMLKDTILGFEPTVVRRIIRRICKSWYKYETLNAYTYEWF